MPNSALTDSLVATMLHKPDLGPLPPGRVEVLPDMDGPLWEAMRAAFDQHCTGRAGYAAEIEALRDWLFFRTCHTTHSLEVRDLLTEQARIARG